MKKIIKYVLFIFAVFLINIGNADAQQYNGVIEKGEAIDGIYYYKKRTDAGQNIYPTHTFHEQAHIYRDSINHNIVYCIESWKHLSGAVAGDYFVYDTNVEKTNLSNIQIENINAMAYFGYGYKDDNYDHTSPEWYALTQMVIWEYQAPQYQHFLVDSLTSTTPNTDYNPKMQEIMILFSQYNIGVDIPGTNMLINTSESVIPNVGSLDYYQVENSDDGIDVSIQDNKAIIKSLNKAGSFNYKLKREYNRWNKGMKVYVSDNYQNVLEPGDLPDGIINKTVNVNAYNMRFAVSSVVPTNYLDGEENYSKITFPNVELAIIAKSDIYDGAGNLIYKKGDVYSKVKSKKDYSSVILPPGDFELRVIKDILGFKSNPENFTITDSDIEVEIKLVKGDFVINIKKLLEKTNTSGLLTYSPGSHIQFGLYSGENIYNYEGNLFLKKDSLIKTLETDESGLLSTTEPFLLPGLYYIKEISELESDYLINDNKYYITLAYDEEFKDKVETEQVLVLNRLKTGKVSILKLDADEYLPLENVSFSVYGKNNNLLETKTTNSSGQIDFDLKIGEYYIKENTALDGYIKDDNIYYIRIDSNNLNPTYKLLNKKIIKEDNQSDENKEDNQPDENKKDDPNENNLNKDDEPNAEEDKKSEDKNLEDETPKKDSENTDEEEKDEPIITENQKNELDIQEANKEEELIVNVPSTNVYDYSTILLFLLSITIISIKRWLKIF